AFLSVEALAKSEAKSEAESDIGNPAFAFSVKGFVESLNLALINSPTYTLGPINNIASRTLVAAQPCEAGRSAATPSGPAGHARWIPKYQGIAIITCR